MGGSEMEAVQKGLLTSACTRCVRLSAALFPLLLYSELWVQGPLPISIVSPGPAVLFSLRRPSRP